MKRLLTTLLLACALPLFAQTAPDTPPTPPADPVADAKGATDEPISFSFGPNDDGGFGIVVKGSAYYPLRRFIDPAPMGTPSPLKEAHFGGFFTPSAYLYLSPEVNWSTESGAQNQYAVSARPSFQVGFQKDVSKLPDGPDGLPPLPASLPWQIWPVSAPFFEAYADVRRQSAQAETSPATPSTLAATATPQNVDATFYGAGIGIAVPFLSRAIEASNQSDPDFEPGVFPMIRVTYYKSDGASASDSPIASDIKNDQIDASLNFSLPLRQIGNIKSRLDFDGDLSRPLTGNDKKWKSLVKASIMLEIGNSSFKPVLSYTSGQKLGFQYDKQMLLGIAMDFANGLFNSGK